MRVVLVPLAEGFEEIEAVTIIDVLLRGEVAVETAAVRTESKIVKGSHGIQIVADHFLKDVVGTEYNMIVLPGGMPGAQNLQETPELVDMLKKQRLAGRWYAAICASPSVVLDSIGLLEGRRACGYPGFKLDGAEAVEEARVVVSENCVTSIGPSSAMEFALKLVEVLKGKTTAEEVQSKLLFQASAC